MSPVPFSATLEREEAVLRFPFDEGLRQLLRAIPGRRWDPVERAWCLPLEPDQAEALARLLRRTCQIRLTSAMRWPGRSPAAARAGVATSVWSTSRDPTGTGGSASPPTPPRS